MFFNHACRLRTWLLCCCLLTLFLAGCSTSTDSKTTTTSTATAGAVQSPSATLTAPASPVADTSCPPVDTVRTPVYTPMISGTAPALLYVVNDIASKKSSLLRYDTRSGQKTSLVSLQLLNGLSPGIADAQLSADGQWILFDGPLQDMPDQHALQIIRVDGQGLQTLFCPTNSEVMSEPRWSPDRKLVAFLDVTGNLALIDLVHGTIQQALAIPSDNSSFFEPGGWLDATHLLVSISNNPNVTGKFTTVVRIAIVDTNKGDQQVNSLPTLLTLNVFCNNLGISKDSASLLLSQCNSQGSNYHGAVGLQGPSTISSYIVSQGKLQTLYHDPSYAITQIARINSQSLAFVIDNKQINTGKTANTGHNGLWIVNMDGTGAKEIQGISAEDITGLMISSDGSMYALSTLKSAPASPGTTTLIFGSIDHGFVADFAAASASSISLIGWTTT